MVGQGMIHDPLGPGRSIIILEDGWGQDQVTVDCNGSSVNIFKFLLIFPDCGTINIRILL